MIQDRELLREIATIYREAGIALIECAGLLSDGNFCNADLDKLKAALDIAQERLDKTKTHGLLQ
jgi:hypothetical protein